MNRLATALLTVVALSGCDVAFDAADASDVFDATVDAGDVGHDLQARVVRALPSQPARRRRSTTSDPKREAAVARRQEIARRQEVARAAIARRQEATRAALVGRLRRETSRVRAAATGVAMFRTAAASIHELELAERVRKSLDGVGDVLLEAAAFERDQAEPCKSGVYGVDCGMGDGWVWLSPRGRYAMTLMTELEAGGTGCADITGTIVRLSDGAIVGHRELVPFRDDCDDREDPEALDARDARRVNRFVAARVARGWRRVRDLGRGGPVDTDESSRVELEGALTGYVLELSHTRWWLTLHLVSPDGTRRRVFSEARRLVSCETYGSERECSPLLPFVGGVALARDAGRLMIRLGTTGAPCWSDTSTEQLVLELPGGVRRALALASERRRAQPSAGR